MNKQKLRDEVYSKYFEIDKKLRKLFYSQEINLTEYSTREHYAYEQMMKEFEVINNGT